MKKLPAFTSRISMAAALKSVLEPKRKRKKKLDDHVFLVSDK
jgi:hypothetical protein